MTDRERRELIKDLQSAVHNKAELEIPTWIMESPDGGKTISKRKFGEQEKFYLDNVGGKWYNYKDALAAVRQQNHESELREQHPSLKDAWEVYQALLGVVDSDVNKDAKGKV